MVREDDTLHLPRSLVVQLDSKGDNLSKGKL
jgi:hypothetical protein